MIKSTANGDYKFFGGGIEAGETKESALAREIKEECGALLTLVISDIGRVIEYKEAIEDDCDVFQMTSYYYLNEVETDYYQQNLDSYEEDLGYKPLWVDITAAAVKNSRLLRTASIGFLAG